MAAAAACLPTVIASPAQAGDNFYAFEGVYFNDNSYVGFVYSSIIQSRWSAATEWSRINTWETTELSTAVESTNNNVVDLYVSNGGTGSAAGYYQCMITKNSYECEHANIVYNAYADYGSGFNRHVACQEIGHSVGLQHGFRDWHECMNNSLSSPYLGSHNADAVNDYYRDR